MAMVDDRGNRDGWRVAVGPGRVGGDANVIEVWRERCLFQCWRFDIWYRHYVYLPAGKRVRMIEFLFMGGPWGNVEVGIWPPRFRVDGEGLW